MKQLGDPARVREGGEPGLAELRELLSQAQLQAPNAAQLARMRGVLGIATPSTSSEPAAPVHPPSGIMRLSLRKGLLGGFVLGAIGVGLTLFLAKPQLLAKPQQSASPPVPRPRAALMQPATLAPQAEVSAQGIEARREPAGFVPVVDANALRRAGERHARVSPRPAPPPLLPLATDPAAELDLLERARAYMRATPEHALALTEEHRAHYANGMLGEEREVLAIEALLLLERTDAAARRTRQFFARYPDSAHARRISALFAEHAPALWPALEPRHPRSSN